MACPGRLKATGVVPIFVSLLMLSSVARAPAATPTPTPSLEGQTFTFPWPPEWVAHGKYQKMVLRGIMASNPGEWDVQACGTLPLGERVASHGSRAGTTGDGSAAEQRILHTAIGMTSVEG